MFGIASQRDFDQQQVKRTLDASAKAVEILRRVRGTSEQAALEQVSAWLTRVHEAEQEGRKLPTPGHLRPGEELASLWKRFPAYTVPSSVPVCYSVNVPK